MRVACLVISWFTNPSNCRYTHHKSIHQHSCNMLESNLLIRWGAVTFRHSVVFFQAKTLDELYRNVAVPISAGTLTGIGQSSSSHRGKKTPQLLYSAGHKDVFKFPVITRSYWGLLNILGGLDPISYILPRPYRDFSRWTIRRSSLWGGGGHSGNLLPLNPLVNHDPYVDGYLRGIACIAHFQTQPY